MKNAAELPYSPATVACRWRLPYQRHNGTHTWRGVPFFIFSKSRYSQTHAALLLSDSQLRCNHATCLP
jgi:hypothetical protein